MSLEFLAKKLARQEAAGLRRRPRVFSGAVGPRVEMDGRAVLHLGSNAYLGLNAHPGVVAAAQTAAREFGTGSGASRLISGTTPLHRELEAELAELKRTEDCLLFGTGYLANLGTIPALVGAPDLLLADALNHASLIDAARLSRATVREYRHADAGHLADLLATERPKHRRCLIVTDGVFSMDGDLAPLPEICALAERHDAILMVDDAHGTGVLGETGAGTAEHLGVSGRIPIQMGTLSKALASEGGFVCGSRTLCEYLRNRARAYIFSTAPAPPSVAAALAALRLVRREPSRCKRDRLRENAERLRAALAEQGWRVPPGETPILPVMVGEAEAAVALAEALLEEGVFAPAIRPPSVPPGSSRLRVTVMATHTDEDLEAAVRAFAAAGKRTGVLP